MLAVFLIAWALQAKADELNVELVAEVRTKRITGGRVLIWMHGCITFSHEGKPPDHIVFLKMSRRDKAIFQLLKT